MSQLDRNTATLNELLELAQNLPEAGTALPELTNPGTAGDMLSGKELIDADGNIVVGTIPTVNASSIVMGGATTEGKVTATYTHLAGYKASRETVAKTIQLSTQAGKTITPTKSRQTAVSSRKWTTGDVYVAAIPSNYADVSGLVIEPQDVVAGVEFIDSDGNRNTGTMPNIGSVTASLDPMSGVETYTVPKGYHDGTGIVGIGEELKDALITINGNTATNVAGAVNNVDTAVTDQASLISQIQTALEGKAAGGGSGSQVATGTFSIDSNITTADTTILEIAGLGFAPNEVYIYPYIIGGLSPQRGTTYFIGCYITASMSTPNTLYVSRSTASSSVPIINASTSSSYSKILFTDDGFSLSTGTSAITLWSNMSWFYVALKREV